MAADLPAPRPSPRAQLSAEGHPTAQKMPNKLPPPGALPSRKAANAKLQQARMLASLNRNGNIRSDLGGQEPPHPAQNPEYFDTLNVTNVSESMKSLEAAVFANGDFMSVEIIENYSCRFLQSFLNN